MINLIVNPFYIYIASQYSVSRRYFIVTLITRSDCPLYFLGSDLALKHSSLTPVLKNTLPKITPHYLPQIFLIEEENCLLYIRSVNSTAIESNKIRSHVAHEIFPSMKQQFRDLGIRLNLSNCASLQLNHDEHSYPIEEIELVT